MNEPRPLPFAEPATPPAEPLPARTPGESLAANQFVVADENGEVDGFNPDDYEYVRIGGQVRAIPKASVSDEPETATQAVPKAAMVEVVDPHFYVWLADGNVIRVKQSDLPTPAGTNANYGHWQIDSKVFQIVNVVPVEDIVKGDPA